MALQGIDVSNFKDIDVSKARDFVVVQTTWGVGGFNGTNLYDGVSTIADRQYQSALAAGKRTAYMHYYMGNDPAAEADFAYRHNQGYIGNGILMIDWEEGDNPHVNNAGRFEQVLTAFEQRFGGPGIVYYQQSLYDMCKPIADRHNWGSFVAQYANTDPTGVQETPWNEGAYDCAMRQYSSTGDIGVGTAVDLDKFYGDLAAWDAYASAQGRHTVTIPVPPAPVDLLSTHVHYRLHELGGGWLDEVTDFGGGDNGFAGMPFASHDLLSVRVDEGSLRYRVHVLGGDWQEWVDRSDINDTVNGCAGLMGQAIDGVQLYYTTPAGKPLSQAWYRAQTASREGWLDTVCDDGTSYGGDDFAGMLGEPLDRLQIAICDQNPYR